MKTDLCGDEVIVQLTNPQILSETVSLMGSSAALIPNVGAAARASSAAVECGRRLLLAARAGDTDTVRLLMAKGAPFTTDWLGTSPLHLAAANDHCETVGVLLRAGVSRDARTKVERTPLHLAAYAGHANTVNKLLEGGALVDARDLLRMTPLHWAVERGHAAAARALLRHGADPTATSKFHKTPLSIATALAHRGDNNMLRLIEECLKEREAANSVDALVTDRAAEETVVIQPEVSTVRIQRRTDPTVASPNITSTPEKKQPKSAIKYIPIDMNSAGGVGGGGGGGTATGGGGGTAEALLRRHGITLLPADDGSTVLSALQSGRTVVLSDAGKLMLKESNSLPPPLTPSPPSPGSPRSPRSPRSSRGEAGVVLTATPVSAPPPGVKVFTLNSNAKLLPVKEQKQQPHQVLRRGSDKTDVQQVKLVQLGAAGPTTAPGGGGGGKGGAGGAARAAVRIIMNKQNFRKLIHTATRATVAEDSTDMDVDSEASSSGSDGESDSVVVVPEQFVRSASQQYLRSQLLCAHAALHHLHRRLRSTRRKLAALRAAANAQPQHEHEQAEQ